MEETKKRGRPRLTEEEKAERAKASADRRAARLVEKSLDEARSLIKIEEGASPVGRGSRYGFSNAQLKLIEQDDEKRAFMAKCITNNLVFFNMGLEPVKNDEELCERLNWFFMQCAETQQLPTVEKMSNCLGYHRNTIFDWEQGNNSGFTPATGGIIRKAKQILASIDAELAQEGKIQPVVYMFRSKNFYGMRDQQEVVVTPNNAVETVDVETIEAKYAELPED